MNAAQQSSVVSVSPYSQDKWLQAIADGGCFILAEAALNDAVPSLAERLNHGAPELSRLYWGETGRLHASISPYLIQVTEDNWAELQQKICHNPHWGIALQVDWFMLAFTPDQLLIELVTHLRQWSWLDTPEGEQRILRVAHWQVLNTLLQASSANEAAAIFGPIAQFIAIDGSSMKALTQGQPQKTDIPHRTPQTLSAMQWQALDKLGQRQQHQDYQQHLNEHHPDTQNWDDTTMHQFIETHLEAAQQHKFASRQEQIKYLSLAFIFDGGLLQHRWAQDLIKKTPKGEKSRMDALYNMALKELDKDANA